MSVRIYGKLYDIKALSLGKWPFEIEFKSIDLEKIAVIITIK